MLAEGWNPRKSWPLDWPFFSEINFCKSFILQGHLIKQRLWQHWQNIIFYSYHLLIFNPSFDYMHSIYYLQILSYQYNDLNKDVLKLFKHLFKWYKFIAAADKQNIFKLDFD